MAAHHFLSGEGGLWVQRSGPGSPVAFLGCHQVGDVDQPDGDIEIIYCPDPSAPNRFRAVGSVQGASGAITTTITTDVMDEFDELERVRCPMNLFVNYRRGGRADVFMNFDRTFVFVNARITSRGLSNMVARTPDDNGRVEQTFDISAEQILRLAEPSISRQTIAETQTITDITFCNDENCRTDEEAYQAACQVGFAATTPVALATANVLRTTNGGTWTATAADPFAADAVIAAIDCFEYGRDTTRVIVARGTADAGPADIAYSDDSGATWNGVAIGTVNGQYVVSPHALHALDVYNIWVVTSGGYIYKSEDGGLSWRAQESGAVTTAALRAVRFVDDAVGWAGGDNNVLLRTTDGGTTWSAIAGPAAKTVEEVNVIEVLDRNRVFIGFSDGTMYKSVDAGANWTQVSFTGTGVGSVNDIRMVNDVLGYMIRDTTAPVGRLLWTIDGGLTWSEIPLNTNAGYNALHICNEWSLFIAGDAVGGTGYIAKVDV